MSLAFPAFCRGNTVCLLLALTVSACSKDSRSTPESDGGGGPSIHERPEGPAADLSEEITGGNGPFIGAGDGFPVPAGYVDHEYVAVGTATAYQIKGTLTDDGHWSLEPSTTADYRTRVIIRRPASAANASGTVLVEWLNVSGGVDANPDYASLSDEIIRRGHIWVGVSAQYIGVAGGPVLVSAPGGDGIAGKGLTALDPARYSSLEHPGDAYSFDIFTQVTRALLVSGSLLGGVKPKIVLGVGESQSAFAMTSYYNGVQPLTLAFDGFFVHSRGGATLPIAPSGSSTDLVGALGSMTHPILRDDLDAPAMEIQAESDVTGILSSVVARQPDTERFRLWEVAGTAHADAHLLGPSAAGAIDCGTPINDGPMHLVAKAALRGLEKWIGEGKLPPTAPHLDTTDATPPDVRRDADGLALGGLRTPPVDVPVDVLSGLPGPNMDVICLLLGSTKPLPDARLKELYATRDAYQKEYDDAADKAITAGYVLEDDRAALKAYAQPSRIAQ